MSALTAYMVTFERIGRSRTVNPLTVKAEGPNHLAELIHQYARPYLLSRDVEVVVDLPAGKGHILCGFNSGGNFTIAAAEPMPIVKYLHPTDTRLALHAEVLANRVFRDAIGDSYISGGRKVTGAIAELEAAGWVYLAEAADSLQQCRQWRSTPYGDAIRAVRILDFGFELGLQMVAESGPVGTPRVLGRVEVVELPKQRRRWQITVGGDVEVVDNRPLAARELRHRAYLALAAEAVTRDE